MIEEINNNNNNNNGQWRDKSLNKIFFIVLLLMSCGLWCGLYLVFHGFCCEVLPIYFQIGKVPSVDIRELIYEGLYHIVSYGVFGENGTQDVLRGRNGLFWNLNLTFATPCWSGVCPLIFFLVLIF